MHLLSPLILWLDTKRISLCRDFRMRLNLNVVLVGRRIVYNSILEINLKAIEQNSIRSSTENKTPQGIHWW